MRFKPRYERLSRRELTADEEFELILGPGSFSRPAFPTEEARKAAWREFREPLLAEHGHIWAFWHFEVGEFPRKGESCMAALKRLGIAALPADAPGIRMRGTGKENSK